MLWLVLGTITVMFNSENLFNYGYFIMAILYVGNYLNEDKKQYHTVENGIISKDHLIPKKVILNKIK
jgi:hypothetical protein